ncbi:MAG: signal peptidase I [Chloroflexi bacterium]|nr:signal peptidase I [Chloroflexota bacterium]
MKSLLDTLIEWLSFYPFKVAGQSMEPAFSENTWVAVFRAGFRSRDPRRFDVVRLEDPRRPNRWMLKRIVGLPGDEVALRAGELFVDGDPVAEPQAYCPEPVADNVEWWLRDDEFVVLGDNRTGSTDSRKFGPVKRASIRGRVRG